MCNITEQDTLQNFRHMDDAARPSHACKASVTVHIQSSLHGMLVPYGEIVLWITVDKLGYKSGRHQNLPGFGPNPIYSITEWEKILIALHSSQAHVATANFFLWRPSLN